MLKRGFKASNKNIYNIIGKKINKWKTQEISAFETYGNPEFVESSPEAYGQTFLPYKSPNTTNLQAANSPNGKIDPSGDY